MKFHQGLREFLSNGTQQDLTYGRYKPCNRLNIFAHDARFNVDQVPLSFGSSGGKIWDVKGAKRVCAKSDGPSEEKRMATMQLCITPDGDPIPPTLIFRGKGKVSAAEIKMYAKGCYVAWQPKAWADTAFCVWWAKNVFAKRCIFLLNLIDTSKDIAKILFCDNLAAQESDDYRAALLAHTTYPYYGPANNTEHWQPVCAQCVTPCTHALTRTYVSPTLCAFLLLLLSP